MSTAYDWITVIIFAGLITHFLHQATKPDGRDDPLRHYLIASVGCAAANWLGNEGWHWAAIPLIAAVLWYAFHFLVRTRPPPRGR